MFRTVCSTAVLLLLASTLSAGDWPQAAGPHGMFRVEGEPPLEWSVTRDENIRWRMPLPEGGQSTVVVAGGRAYVTTHTPLPGQTGMAKDVLGHCLDAETGRVLWTCELPGSRPLKMAGIFSDSTSPSPIADDRHVWFFNASGSMGCWTAEGKPVWFREWTPRGKHHSRQHEPIRHGDDLLFVEVRNKELGGGIKMHGPAPKGIDEREVWTYLHAINASTGDVRRIEDVGTAIHNTPLIGHLTDGSTAILHGRGGGHQPFEKPYGLSLTRLDEETGDTLWSVELPKSASYQNSHFDARRVVWFDGTDHLVLDTATGSVRSRTSLVEGVTLRARNAETGEYETRENVDLGARRNIAHTNQSNILVGGWHWFLAHGRHAIGRVHLETGRVEYFDVPAGIVRTPNGSERPWTDDDRIDIANARGEAFSTADGRSRGSGWGHVSAASPIAVGRYILFPLMTGTCFVVDASVPQLDERAIVAVNDLGPGTKTWSLSSYSFADGSLFARTATEVVRIGTDEVR